MSEGREATSAAEGDASPGGLNEERPGTTVTSEKDLEGPIVVSPSVYRRLMTGAPAYLGAMLTCLAVVGLVVLITPRRNEDAMPRVDYRSDLSGLTAIAPYQVQAPQGLPPAWFPTSTRLSGHPGGPISWHLGFYTPRKEYAALEESDESPADGPGHYIDRMTSQGRTDGTATIAGAVWDRTLREDKNQRSLVRRLPGVTLVVTGTASYEELAALAGALRPQPKPSTSATPVR